jgi:integrase
MSVQRDRKAWRVRWKEGERWRSRTFKRKSDALLFDGELRRRRRLGDLARLDAGAETLDAYITETWASTYAALLAPSTRQLYSHLYDHHIAPTLGSVPLRELTPELIGRWQSQRIAAGAGAEPVRKALTLLGGILQRAAESGRIASNPARLVRKAPRRRRAEVRPLAPATIEAMRAVCGSRDAALISVLAYAGLRPGEALALRWRDVREQTLLVERAVSLGVEKDTKTSAHRTVRLLSPLAQDLREWRMASGRPDDDALIFPGRDGEPWTAPAYQSWRRRAFARALEAGRGLAIEPSTQTCPTCNAARGRPCRKPSGRQAKRAHAARGRMAVEGRPYDLRHSFASLLLHEGRSVIYVARQLGHGAQLTLGTYGHVIDELDDRPQQDAQAAITAARLTGVAAQLPRAAE